MNGWMAFLSILAVVAIIVVAAGIIVAIGHMIIGAFDGDRKEVKDSTEEYQVKDEATYNATNEYDFEAINKAKAEEEKALIEKEEGDEFKLDEEEDSELSEIEESLKEEAKEDSDEDLDDVDVDDLLEDISNEVVEDEMEKTAETVAPSEELENYSIESYLEEAEAAEGEVEEEPAEEVEETTNVEQVVEEVTTEENDEELEASKKEIEELKAQLAVVNEQLANAMSSKAEVVTIDMTEEACLERIAVLEERLKNVKAEYKVNMKEYRPLRKVKNTLDRDKVKLRRRDAIVAKKKIDLYGVANIVDMDKEKAAKLADEIELLDGLRLSVRHCEEVMEANKERYPILEHTNKILEDQIAQIEEDIASAKATLQAIRDKNGSNEGEGDAE